MYQRDYILRMIEQFGRALAALRRRIAARAGEESAVYDELRQTAAQAGLDLDLVGAVNSELLHLLVAPAGEPEPARCWLMAELMYLEALRHGAHGEATARLAARSLELFSMLPSGWSPPEEHPPAAERIAELRAWLGEHRDPTAASEAESPRA